MLFGCVIGVVVVCFGFVRFGGDLGVGYFLVFVFVFEVCVVELVVFVVLGVVVVIVGVVWFVFEVVCIFMVNVFKVGDVVSV